MALDDSQAIQPLAGSHSFIARPAIALEPSAIGHRGLDDSQKKLARQV
ncbi:MAG: hypothetical protein IJU40_09065 [Desulfovibrionaceae bacterium]|nr:hypothetical protein [Desulfovibrionaceae bacterium]